MPENLSNYCTDLFINILDEIFIDNFDKVINTFLKIIEVFVDSKVLLVGIFLLFQILLRIC
jgi:hypothetical protein